jgi:hypothetical protein
VAAISNADAARRLIGDLPWQWFSSERPTAVRCPRHEKRADERTAVTAVGEITAL